MSIFSQISNKKPRTNIFNLSHDRKFSFKMGQITPIMCLETVPGDRFNLSTSQLLRFAPMLAPIMHEVNVYTHFFYVPNRILWDNWEDFITGGEDGQSTPQFPNLAFTGQIPNGSLADYYGIPSNLNQTGALVSAIPFAGYNKIYNEYYRDQNLIDPKPDELSDGNNSSLNSTFLSEPYNRAWQHDYFTSALPWTQKGAEATIPLGTQAPLGYDPGTSQDPAFTQIWNIDGSFLPAPANDPIHALQGGTQDPALVDVQGRNIDFDLSRSGNFVDLSEATASTIIDLRRAFKLQEWLEKNARGGSRYIESIMSHFGVRSKDQRLQRPEFLGGSKSPLKISEVLQTSAVDAQPTPQGNLAGYGISAGSNSNISYYCEEHGYIHGFITVMPKPAYFQGLPKHFFKFDKFDYYWPSFAHIGEQPIINKELYLGDNIEENEETFGYTPRYAEYKFIPSSVHGEYRTTLDFWHLARKFDNMPKLNQEFIEVQQDNDGLTRIFAVEEGETLYCHIYNKVKARRPMPYFGSPKM